MKNLLVVLLVCVVTTPVWAAEFMHHPDGFVIIDDFRYPVEEFLIDEPAYEGLPPGVIGRHYVQGKRHALFSRNKVERGGPLRWADGDRYIANQATYKAAYALRLEARKPLPGPDRAAFEVALAGIFGNDPMAYNAFMQQYPLFLVSLREGGWYFVQELIKDARAKAVITPRQYADIRTAVGTTRIPIVLP